MKNKLESVKEGSRTAAASQTKTSQSRAGQVPRKLPVDWVARHISKEFKVVTLHECPVPSDLVSIDTPELAAKYWRLHIAANPYFNSECECLAVLILDARNRVKGHQLISIGTLDTLLVHAREVFRAAIVATAASIILMHNHPSGESTPSASDIKVTLDLARGGQLLNIEVLDHVIVGQATPQRPKDYTSLKELGYFDGIGNIACDIASLRRRDGRSGKHHKMSKREESSIIRLGHRILKQIKQHDQRRAA
jgi:hypothetical protein